MSETTLQRTDSCGRHSPLVGVRVVDNQPHNLHHLQSNIQSGVHKVVQLAYRFDTTHSLIIFTFRLLQCKCQRLSRPPRYRSVNENRNSALLAQTPSSAAAGAATVPLSLSLQGTPLVTPSSVSSFLTNVRTPANQSSQSESFDMAESSTG